MNFLAHIYLSGNNDFMKIGGFMADGVRGKDYEHFPDDIRKGILLHRAIDTFTDAHAVFRISKHRLHERYGHYSGVIIDVFYDHFLAKNWQDYSDEKLDVFVQNFYQSLEDNFDMLTPKVQNMLPHMERGNWLWNYQFVDGIGTILSQMDRRTKNTSKMGESVQELEQFYKEFEQEFTLFFKELREFVAEKIKTL
ncbi:MULTISPECIES: ACP phosphodiesterase [Flavobacterium]|jgi:acyl carrier protein phosphodiesterase|uniref:Acyl carrier protein phosphodiesterase n=1 Tax=Flavobacterium lindanitolerans TaxID=428988 RepID=A0A497UV16_9FLAO|nr:MULTISPECIES: acyl carrier protein phosphodiesterase [Flavobacterium]OJX49854.1 MAG: ACP phosphodiesterase [Flavobacterium sp. 38-13]PKW20867.1 acyl carrier protein phosphodiesterase [Flavobacterium lindanitolerans]RLJ30494.1 acyl carrier protein phosphodiesterase [Flavobacterium lindanitolerans]